jgi:hypothetical protein
MEHQGENPMKFVQPRYEPRVFPAPGKVDSVASSRLLACEVSEHSDNRWARA